MRFTLTVECENDEIETGSDLAELLVRVAPAVERGVGANLANSVGSIQGLYGKQIGTWTFIKRRTPEASLVSQPATRSDHTRHPTVREINTHLLDDSYACYVRIENQLIRIRHVRIVKGQLQGKSLNRPGEWIAIPPDAKFELLN